MFAGIILLPLIAWRWFPLNEVAAFWCVYVITRPLGALVGYITASKHGIQHRAEG